MKKNQPKNCLRFYTKANCLEELKQNARAEIKLRKQIVKQNLLEKHLDTAKYHFTKNVEN